MLLLRSWDKAHQSRVELKAGETNVREVGDFVLGEVGSRERSEEGGDGLSGEGDRSSVGVLILSVELGRDLVTEEGESVREEVGSRKVQREFDPLEVKEGSERSEDWQRKSSKREEGDEPVRG